MSSQLLKAPPLARAEWMLSLYPQAGEAGGCFIPTRRAPRPATWGPALDPDRARVEAARRARGKVRRYCAANRLNRLGTLTYRGEGCHDPGQLRADVGEFFRQLRAELGGKPLAYLWVAEWHKTGHGQHVHFAVGRYVRRGLIEAAWGRGFVHIKLLGNLPVGAGPLAEARRAASYLSKYVAKSFDAERVPGLHRYEVAQGFQPHKLRLSGVTDHQVVGLASAQLGAPPEHIWRSSQMADWTGPPAVWASWAG